jgi:hypothetical protein
MVRWCLSVIFALAASPSLAADFRLTSPDLKEQGKIANKHVYSGFGCSGGNTSPELHWENAPKETKSFAVTVYDPGCADRQRLVALGDFQYPGDRAHASGQCRKTGRRGGP